MAVTQGINFYNMIAEGHRQIPWPRILAEGAAIVVSILVAFWIDAWWDEIAILVIQQA